MTEKQVFSLYRRQLQLKCGVPFAADLIIPHATHDRTWFRLVVGGHDKAVVELFRHVEKRICGAEAGEVRNEARSRGEPQLSLGLSVSQSDLTYRELHDVDLQQASEELLKVLAQQRSPLRFDALWPRILAERHITRTELGREVWELRSQGKLVIQNLAERQRAPKDDSILTLAADR